MCTLFWIYITFRADAKMILSDKILTSQTILINFLNDFIEMINELTRLSKDKINIKFILKCIELLKKYSKILGKVFFTYYSMTD